MTEEKKLVSVADVRESLPAVIERTRELLEKNSAIGVITIAFLENGDAVEVSDTRICSLYQIVGSLEMIKARYLRGPV